MFVSYSFGVVQIAPPHNKILLVPLKTIGPLEKVFSTPMYTSRIFLIFDFVDHKDISGDRNYFM